MAVPAELGAWVTTGVCAVLLGFEKFKASRLTARTNQESETLSAAKMQEARADLFAKMADDAQKALEKEYAAHVETRKFWHDKAGEWEATSKGLTLQILDLQAKPDYADILNVIRDQGKHIQKQGEILQRILVHLESMSEHHSHPAAL